ncbi:MAG TPA: acyl-CoA dehydrogenase N-terminal domain-containing protein, partial [Acidimicrobiales bacterium]|nr:acyl-CoA dehydrogenase N-terminal domain-containing protein [Acidimicrobiales bacterium]
MADYTAPLDDIRFVLDHVARLGDLTGFEGFGHADPDTVHGVLEECARFMGGVVAPLNRVGDLEGSRRNEDGTVTTPTGFPSAYRR